jgi:hypothetical protein
VTAFSGSAAVRSRASKRQLQPRIARFWRAADVVPVLDRVRPSGDGFVACCPAHHDTEPSLSIADGEAAVVVHCHAGCSQAAVLEALVGRGVDLRKPATNRQLASGLTLNTLSIAKQLRSSLLAECGVRDVVLGGTQAVGFEYRDRDGRSTGIKYRRAMEGDRGFSWRTGSKPRLYGLWRTGDLAADDRIFVLGRVIRVFDEYVGRNRFA